MSHPSLFFSDMNGIPNAILKLQTGKRLFVRQIVEVTRVNFLPSYEVFSVSLMLGFQEVMAGFTWGQVRIAPLRADELEDAADASIALSAQSDSNLAEDVRISVHTKPCSSLSKMRISVRIWRDRLAPEM